MIAQERGGAAVSDPRPAPAVAESGAAPDTVGDTDGRESQWVYGHAVWEWERRCDRTANAAVLVFLAILLLALHVTRRGTTPPSVGGRQGPPASASRLSAPLHSFAFAAVRQ